MLKELSVKDYCLRWVGAFHCVTPEDVEMRQYAIAHVHYIFNGEIAPAQLETMLVSDDQKWRSLAVDELSRITGTDKLSIQKNWGRYFDDAPKKLYSLTVFADAFNRVAIYYPNIPNYLQAQIGQG